MSCGGDSDGGEHFFPSMSSSDPNKQLTVSDWMELKKHQKNGGDSLFHFHTALSSVSRYRVSPVPAHNERTTCGYDTD